ncbi:LSU ribosomal protein L29P [Thaumarchaeota archaeon SCGC AB-539-E09]|nr:LSU ribosomal protein L29P [Thaumarchaeota archaeon SCGC AB-539-E09]
MPFLKVQEIREMSQVEKTRRLDELRTELSKLRTMIKAGGSIENPGRVKAIRKAIARIMTVMREEELQK